MARKVFAPPPRRQATRRMPAPVKPYRPPTPKLPKPPAGGWTDWLTQTGRAGGESGIMPGDTLQDAFRSGRLSPAGLENLFQPGELSIGIPGYHPPGMDIGGDWEYQAALGDVEAANRADEAAAAEQINALAVGWGGDLSGMVQQGLISQAAADAAKANQFSQMAELGRTLQTGLGQGYSQLAARGILSSGAMPGLTEELNRGYQQQTQTGLQNLMGQIRGVRSGQAQAAAQRRQGLAGVRSSVANRLASLEAYQPIPDMVAQWDPSVGAYVDNWGRRFIRRGNETVRLS